VNKVAYTTTIKELPADDRPRERLRAFGPAALSNAELIAILLGGGYRNFSALNLSQYLLQEHQGLTGLAEADIEALLATKGVGPAKACTLAAAFELGRRVSSGGRRERPSVTSPEDAAAVLMPRYGDKPKEHVGILALDAKNRVIKEEIVSVGILDGSMVHPREVFRPAVLSNAAAVILFHNHPSGDPSPSGKDVEITRRLVEAGRLMGVELLDHLVVTRQAFVSLKQRGLM
jgi:DNA repair protein RadC